MTAALLNTIEIARRLGGRCVMTKRGSIISRGGNEHADCSTCEGRCDIGDMGLAGDGFSIIGTNSSAELRWRCPGCGASVREETTAIDAHTHAEQIKRDPLCVRCRRTP